MSVLAGLVDTRGFREGGAREALFALPVGLTVRDDNIYVADAGNNRIRKITVTLTKN